MRCIVARTQASDDEEAAREEEAEAVRLQREAAAGLRPEDYADGLDLEPADDEGDSDAEEEPERGDEPRTMGGAANRVRCRRGGGQSWLHPAFLPHYAACLVRVVTSVRCFLRRQARVKVRFAEAAVLSILYQFRS